MIRVLLLGLLTFSCYAQEKVEVPSPSLSQEESSSDQEDQKTKTSGDHTESVGFDQTPKNEVWVFPGSPTQKMEPVKDLGPVVPELKSLEE